MKHWIVNPPCKKHIAFQNVTDLDECIRYYYTLMKRVDQQLMRLIPYFESMEKTYIIYTSDHGELLGSHGRMFQKWVSAYEEIIHIPMYIKNTSDTFSQTVNHYQMTSHVDILPTILDLAQVTINKSQLQKQFSLVPNLIGRPMFNSHNELDMIRFFSCDNPTKGDTQVTFDDQRPYNNPASRISFAAAFCMS